MHCREVTNVTKGDVDRFLGFQLGLPNLCGATGWPVEAYPDLQLYHNRGPIDDDIRREAFECLLTKLNRDAEDELWRNRLDYVRPRDAQDEDFDSGWSESEGSSLTADALPQAQMVSDSHGFSDDADYGFEDWMPGDAEEEPVDAADIY
ncbi:hypothetical protein SLS64_006166 [Diaporthe eres]